MSDIPGRVYRIAKAYLDAAKDRLGEIDAQAQSELSRSLSRDDINIPEPPPASSDDPMERARAKIAAAQQTATARREFTASQSRATTPGGTTTPTAPDPVETSYKIIGVPVGADYPTVQQAVTKLRERCAPTRFADGSEEQAEAKVILQRVEEAYQVLRNALDPGAGRFDKLEF